MINEHKEKQVEEGAGAQVQLPRTDTQPGDVEHLQTLVHQLNLLEAVVDGGDVGDLVGGGAGVQGHVAVL